MSIRFCTALIAILVLAACSGDEPTEGAPEIVAESTEEPVNTRPIVSSDDDINVDVISVQYGQESKYIGALAFNVGTGRPRLPDPEAEIFIVVVREPPSPAQMAGFNLELRPGVAYQWLGGTQFREIMPVDLSLSDEEISKLFGVGRPSDDAQLFELLGKRDTDEAEALELLAASHNIRYRHPAGGSFIHEAAYFGHLAVVKELVVRGVDVNMSGMNGDLPLKMAAAGGSPEIVEYLLGVGAEIDKADIYGETALHSAMHNNGCVECARILINAGADQSLVNEDGLTPAALARSKSASRMINKDAMLEYLATLENTGEAQ